MILAGQTIRLRTIEERDAQDILHLRFEPQARKIYQETSPNLQDQIQWIRDYKKREAEGKDLYFMIVDVSSRALGTVRMYDVEGNAFRWGTWIVAPGSPQAAALESAMLIYCYAFGTLALANSHFEVWNTNLPVLRFHLRCGAEIVKKDEKMTCFTLSRATFEQKTKLKYRKYLPPLPLQIQP